MRRESVTAWIGALAVLASAPALGYVGPGAGLTLLSALWGLLVAVVAAMAFLVVWPIRRWRRRRQASLQTGAELEEPDAVPAAERRSRADADAD